MVQAPALRRLHAGPPLASSSSYLTLKLGSCSVAVMLTMDTVSPPSLIMTLHDLPFSIDHITLDY